MCSYERLIENSSCQKIVNNEYFSTTILQLLYGQKKIVIGQSYPFFVVEKVEFCLIATK